MTDYPCDGVPDPSQLVDNNLLDGLTKHIMNLARDCPCTLKPSIKLNMSLEMHYQYVEYIMSGKLVLTTI